MDPHFFGFNMFQLSCSFLSQHFGDLAIRPSWDENSLTLRILWLYDTRGDMNLMIICMHIYIYVSMLCYTNLHYFVFCNSLCIGLFGSFEHWDRPNFDISSTYIFISSSWAKGCQKRSDLGCVRLQIVLCRTGRTLAGMDLIHSTNLDKHGRTTSANTLELVRTTKILSACDSNLYFLVLILLSRNRLKETSTQNLYIWGKNLWFPQETLCQASIFVAFFLFPHPSEFSNHSNPISYIHPSHIRSPFKKPHHGISPMGFPRPRRSAASAAQLGGQSTWSMGRPEKPRPEEKNHWIWGVPNFQTKPCTSVYRYYIYILHIMCIYIYILYVHMFIYIYNYITYYVYIYTHTFA